VLYIFAAGDSLCHCNLFVEFSSSSESHDCPSAEIPSDTELATTMLKIDFLLKNNSAKKKYAGCCLKYLTRFA
jgi:hypothetical protein